MGAGYSASFDDTSAPIALPQPPYPTPPGPYLANPEAPSKTQELTGCVYDENGNMISFNCYGM